MKNFRGTFHERINPSDEARARFKVTQAHYCARDLRPPNAFRQSGMIQLIQAAVDIGHAFGRVKAEKLIACPSTVKSVLEAEAEVVTKLFISRELHAALEQMLVTFTTDGWTRDKTFEHFYTLTSSFINNKWILVVRTLFIMNLGVRPTAININAAMIQNLQKITIREEELRGSRFVTDGGLDVVKSVHEYIRLYCSCHAINLTTRNTMCVKYSTVVVAAMAAAPRAKELVTQCNLWVQSVRKALPAKHALREGLRCSNAVSESNIPPMNSYLLWKDMVSLKFYL